MRRKSASNHAIVSHTSQRALFTLMACRCATSPKKRSTFLVTVATEIKKNRKKEKEKQSKKGAQIHLRLCYEELMLYFDLPCEV